MSANEFVRTITASHPSLASRWSLAVLALPEPVLLLDEYRSQRGEQLKAVRSLLEF